MYPRLRGAEMSDSAPPAVIALEDVIADIKACYERALKRNPNLSGKVVIHWTITQAGTVSGVDVEQDTLGDAEVASCIKSLVARWRFPAPSGGYCRESFRPWRSAKSNSNSRPAKFFGSL